jgi:hypothetical protein
LSDFQSSAGAGENPDPCETSTWFMAECRESRRISKTKGDLPSQPCKPHKFIDPIENCRRRWNREMFANIQIARTVFESESEEKIENSAMLLVEALREIRPWLSIYTKARMQDNPDLDRFDSHLAIYEMRQFLKQLGEKLGSDEKATAEINNGAYLVTADGVRWDFANTEHGFDLICQEREKQVKKHGKPAKK